MAGLSKNEGGALIRAAVDLRVTFFDTAAPARSGLARILNDHVEQRLRRAR